MNISSPRMVASPSSAGGRAGSSLISPTSTDIQDTNSSHSDQLINNSSSPLAHNSDSSSKQAATRNHHYNSADTQRTNLKTEYKSNFTPFDQYVYNELTDSFVKQQTAAPCNNLLIQSNCRASASNSNQNLASAAQSDVHAANSGSPALEVSAFEPNNGSDHHYDVTKEPWYKEVVKRNEKANEYRFKSEVGHNSPLLKDGSPNDEPMTRRSPLCIETLMDSQSANGDSSSPQALEELSSKRSYKFTPHDYKRDHLIATMANNNNFNLPKKSSTPDTSRVTPARRVPAISTVTSGASRPLSRSTAQVRARSQSSRRQNMATSQAPKKDPATKSNQTTPVKTVPARIATTARVPATKATKAPIGSTTLTKTTTRTVNSASNGASSTTRPSSTISRRAPMSASTGRTAASLVGSQVSKTGPVSARPQAMSSSTAKASPKVASRGTVASTTKTTPTSQQVPKSPAKRVVGSTFGNRTTSAAARPITSTSVRNSMSANKAPATKSSSPSTATTTTNAIKSIKTKALTDAGEKAAAVAVAMTSEPKPPLTSDTNKEAASQDRSEQEHIRKDLEEPNATPACNSGDQPIGQTHTDFFMNQEPNLIFTTSESGNMLADEIAQAERVAKQNELLELSSQQLNTTANSDSPVANSNDLFQTSEELPAITDNRTVSSSDSIDIESREQADVCEGDFEAKDSETKVDSQQGDLVNGLAGQIVSAEDRYDSSEHDASADFQAHQIGQSIGQLGQNNDDEPYSIMPTTFDAIHDETQNSARQNSSDKLESRNSSSPDPSHDEILAEHISQSTMGHVIMGQNSGISDADKLDVEESNSKGAAITQFESDANSVDDFGVNREVFLDGSRFAHDDPSEVTSDDVNKENSISLEVNSARTEEGTKITGHEQAPIEAQEVEIPMSNQEELATASSHQIWGYDSDLKGNVDDYNNGGEEFNTIRRASSREEHDSVLIDKSDLVSTDKPESKVTQDSCADSTPDDDLRGQDSELPQKSPLVEETTNLDKNIQEVNNLIEEHRETDRHEEPQVENQHGQSEGAANENSVDVTDFNESITIEEPPVIETKHELSTNKEDYDLQSHGEDNQQQQQEQQQQETTRLNDSNINYEHARESTDSEHESIDGRTDHNELLMNVADLVVAESRKKEEMSRKSELARQQSNSRASLNFSQPTEILLSPDQLSGQLAQSNDGDAISNVNEAAPQHEDDNNKALNTTHDNEISQHTAPFGDDVNGGSGKSGKQQGTRFDSDDTLISDVTAGNSSNAHISAENVNRNLVQGSTEDLVNIGSLTSSLDKVDQAASEVKLDTNSQQSNFDNLTVLQPTGQQEDSRLDSPPGDSNAKLATDSVEVGTRAEVTEHQDIKIDMQQKPLQLDRSRESIEEREDDSDDEEQLKLSNHLTNSDDDVILEPRNTKNVIEDDYSPHKIVEGSRYNEGAGLSVMAQEEQLECLDTAELADGSSAELVEPTVVEKRIELSTSKSIMPDILPSNAFIHGPKFNQGSNIDYDDDDDDQDLNLNPNADPIDVAATMSPSSSVTEEMMRLSRNASNASTTNITSKLIDELSISKSYSDEFSRANVANDAKEQGSGADQLNKEWVMGPEKHDDINKHEDSVAVSANTNKESDHDEVAGPLESKPTDQVENSSQTISGTTDVSSAGTLNNTNNNNNDINNTMNDSNTTKRNSLGGGGSGISDSNNSDVSQVPSSMMIQDHKD